MVIRLNSKLCVTFQLHCVYWCCGATDGHFYDSISLTVGQLKNLLPYDYDNLIQSLGREVGFFVVGSYTFSIGLTIGNWCNPHREKSIKSWKFNSRLSCAMWLLLHRLRRREQDICINYGRVIFMKLFELIHLSSV